jgi:hypothetical protein
MTPPAGGEALDRAPSAQMITSPNSRPRRPSSQFTNGPSWLQICAIAGRAVDAMAATIQTIQMMDASARAGGIVGLRMPSTDCHCIVAAERFNPPGKGAKKAADGASEFSRLLNRLQKLSGSRPRSLAKVAMPLQERAPGEMAEWLKAHAWKACVRETVPWVRIPLSPPVLRHSFPQYPIVRIYRKATEKFRDFALIPRASCSFSPWVRRRVLPPLHYSPLPLFESTAKTIGGAIKAVAASPLIAAQTVPFGGRFGGWILRGRSRVTLPALRVAIRLPGARSGQRVRQLPELLEASVRGHSRDTLCAQHAWTANEYR